jgi:hypothetical protein
MNTAKEKVLERWPDAVERESIATGCLAIFTSKGWLGSSWDQLALSIDEMSNATLCPVEIIGNHYIHREPSDSDAKFYLRSDVDKLLQEIREAAKQLLDCNCTSMLPYSGRAQHDTLPTVITLRKVAEMEL